MAALCFGAGGEELSESTVLITTRRSSPSVAIRLWPPGEGRCDLCWVGSRSTFVSSFVWLSCIEGFPGTTPNHSLSLEGFDRIIHCFIATQQCTVCPLKHSYFPSFFLFSSSTIACNSNHTVLLTILSDCLLTPNELFTAELEHFQTGS